jgi:oxygen-dependent protoporphyrinogen oxidase
MAVEGNRSDGTPDPSEEARPAERAASAPATAPEATPRVGIVGGGITGLALAHYLADHEVPFVCYERDTEPGGVIRTARTGGHVLERGPQRMRRTPSIEALVADLGLAGQVVTVPEELPLLVYVDGALRRAPLDLRSFLRTDALSWRGKLRLLAEPLTRRGRPEETVGDLFVRKFGREAYERFIGPLYGGIYGSDPMAMPARYALEALLEREATYHSFLLAFLARIRQGHDSPAMSFERGLQTLPEALAALHADAVELGTPVTDVARTADDGFDLETPAGTDHVDELVVTTPAPVAAALLDGVVPGAAGIRDLSYNPLATVFLQSDLDKAAMGYQVAYDEPQRTLGVSWNAAMFDRDGLYTVYLGGMHDPDAMALGDDELAAIATEEFETATGAPATAIDTYRLDPGFPAYDQSWHALENLDLPGDVHLPTNYLGRQGVPSRVREAKSLAATLATDSS